VFYAVYNQPLTNFPRGTNNMFAENEVGIDIDTFDMGKELESFEDYTPNPVHILVRLFINSSRTKSGLYINNENDKYNEIKGYVAKMGACCFEGDRYDNWKDWYKVGDWIVFPRHAGIRFTYKNLPVFSIPDNSPIGIIKNPTEVK